MSKHILSLLYASLGFLPTLAWAQSEGFKVAGEISFKRTADLFVELVTEEEFDRDVESDWQDEATFRVIIKIKEEEQQNKKVSFEFENVPQGTYGIQIFQDVNGNGKFDMGELGPKEPWGNYRQHRPGPDSGPPQFKKLAFEVNQNITDIQIEIPEGFTIAGEIMFKKTGNLFVELVTEEEFKGQKQSPFGLILELSREELKKRKKLFAFYNVPPGMYGIRCFQDVNGNQKLDTGLFGIPREPWGFYRPKRPRFRGPKFKEIAFEVNMDVTDIQFIVK